MKKLHFALIGLGKMGSRWAGVLSKYAYLDAVVTSRGSPTLDDVLADKNIDAVVIAVPHIYLADMTRKVLKAGKHVLCEKPGGIRSNEIRENYDLARKNRLAYMIGYNYRYHDGFIKAWKMYKQGKIGKLVFIRSRFGFGGRLGYEKEWRINKTLGGGGHLHDQGVHMINMVKLFLGPIRDVKGMKSDNYWKSGTEDNGFMLIKGKNNVIASIHSSLTQWKRLHNFEIYGDKGYLIVDGLGMRYGEPERLVYGKRTKNPDVVKEKIIKCNAVADDSLKLELKEFLSLVNREKRIKPLISDAHFALKAVEEVYKEDKK